MTAQAAAEEDFWNVFTRGKRSATPGAAQHRAALEGNKRGRRLGSGSSSKEWAVEQPAFLRSTLGHLLSKLSAETRERVGNSLKQKLHVSTACSGAEQVVVVLKEFAEMFQGTSEQLWACEVPPEGSAHCKSRLGLSMCEIFLKYSCNILLHTLHIDAGPFGRVARAARPPGRAAWS